MSVIVKGMEMPKCCTECSCCRHDNWNGETAHQCNVSLITFSAEDENWIYNTRPKWCPLIELPPHGRLGDLNALQEQIELTVQDAHMSALWKQGMIYAYGLIEASKTVIEAEGETE